MEATMNDYIALENDHTKATVASLEATAFLDELADRLDKWAQQSRSGGWSTHQVQANIDAANECRRMASRLRHAFQ